MCGSGEPGAVREGPAAGQPKVAFAHHFNNLLANVIASLDLIHSYLGQRRIDEIAPLVDVALESANQAAALMHRLAAAPSRQDPARAPHAPTVCDGASILVVEDERTMRLMVVEVLRELGYRVAEAANAPDGLRILGADARIDLLVTDIGLPGGINGRQLADVARLLHPGLKVLFVTGYTDAATIRGANLPPGTAVMTKPFALDTLTTRIRTMITP